MASERQILANTKNAQLSRGPMSDAARSATRENSLKHGLTARQIVLSHEDQQDWLELLASNMAEFAPATAHETRLVEQIAQNYWRLLRARRVETATFENRLATLKRRLEIDPAAEIDNDQGLSICMSNDARDFDTLRRYESAIERAWYRAIHELKTIQKDRVRNASAGNCTNEPKLAVAAAGHAPLSENGIGCVSHAPTEASEHLQPSIIPEPRLSPSEHLQPSVISEPRLGPSEHLQPSVISEPRLGPSEHLQPSVISEPRLGPSEFKASAGNCTNEPKSAAAGYIPISENGIRCVSHTPDSTEN